MDIEFDIWGDGLFYFILFILILFMDSFLRIFKEITYMVVVEKNTVLLYKVTSLHSIVMDFISTKSESFSGFMWMMWK